jgi:1-phosphofructokinase family hexose kinase
VIAFAAPNPSVDRLFATSALLPGAIHRPDAATADAGGKGLNAARAAHVLGADVRAVALVAGHAGRWIADRLAADGVPADLIWGAGETRTCLSVATGGALTEFYEHGDAPGDDVWAVFAARVAAVAGRAAWVALCGSLPPGVDASEAARLVAAARAAGARVAVDHSGAALDAAVDAGPDLVKVNAAEAQELTGEADPLAAAIALRARLGAAERPPDTPRRVAGVATDPAGAAHPVVAVTLGERGALLLADKEQLWGALEVRAPYPVGSGDAFLAGLLAAAQPPGCSWRDAFALALGAGAANAERRGAGRLDPARARALAGRVTLRDTARLGSPG